MRESPQETLSRLGPYPRYPDFCTIQVDQRKGGFDPAKGSVHRLHRRLMNVERLALATVSESPAYCSERQG